MGEQPRSHATRQPLPLIRKRPRPGARTPDPAPPPVNKKTRSLAAAGRNSLYKTVSEGWRTTLGVARWVCDRYGLLTGTGGNRVFMAASGVQILRPRPLASRGDLRAVPPGRYGRRPRSAAAPVGCGQAEKSHADDWSRPDRGVGRARIAGCAVPSLKVARFCTLPPPPTAEPRRLRVPANTSASSRRLRYASHYPNRIDGCDTIRASGAITRMESVQWTFRTSTF